LLSLLPPPPRRLLGLQGSLSKKYERELRNRNVLQTKVTALMEANARLEKQLQNTSTKLMLSHKQLQLQRRVATKPKSPTRPAAKPSAGPTDKRLRDYESQVSRADRLRCCPGSAGVCTGEHETLR